MATFMQTQLDIVFAKSQNRANEATGALFDPVPTSAGVIPPGFPADIAALNALTSSELQALLLAYGVQAIPAGKAQRKAAFRKLIGLRN